MPSWPQLVGQLDSIADPDDRNKALNDALFGSMDEVAKLRGSRNVIFYASGFLQKPQALSDNVMLTLEDLHGFMAVMHGMDFDKSLTLMLHTPGGMSTATETIVHYVRSKFEKVEVIVPTYAMSAGTMIALAADLIILGRQSQLGPIDPFLAFNGRQTSAQAVLDQFERAKSEILSDERLAHLWASVLAGLGPSLLQDARNAVKYGERAVADWLTKYMFRDDPDRSTKAAAVARHFSDATEHLNHGRRIAREEAREQGLNIFELEDDQDLQEATLTAYHAATITFERSPISKMVIATGRKVWTKSLQEPSPPKATKP